MDQLVKLKVIRKLLTDKSFFEDGFEYQFISVEDDEWSIEFTVNVILPKKGQSFVVEKFSSDVSNIIGNIWKYIGYEISYSENFLVEGKEVPNNGIYINPEDCDEIITSLNENVKNVIVSNDKDVSDVRANISFFRNKEIDKFYLMDSPQYIDIFLMYNISKIEYNSTPVNVNLKTIDEFAEVFNEKLQNSNMFRDNLQDIIYRVMEPSFHIENLEVFFNVQYWINKVEGIEVQVDGNIRNTDFLEEMFT
jgi:hypothetical protein